MLQLGPCRPRRAASPHLAAPHQQRLHRTAAAPDTLCDLGKRRQTTQRQRTCVQEHIKPFYAHLLLTHAHLFWQPRGQVKRGGSWCGWMHRAVRAV